ncbi:Uma2 family endonuclease [Spirosoma sp. KCTC 42546]|uniref:Uma2 family endonuclease n=1 Tax=Spirosoma sp. KCTC 42546 TaxID=2520506 RepID=UPI00115A995B|nr:Uma2 family endonuclease [Spirosoma sp. KCTC 42546]QDK77066.1 Uma2 family endonuclease [Spirosoma sp. KCTC 42546]
MESTLLKTSGQDAVIGIPMSKQQFLNWNPDDGFLYEFENGLAIPTDGMKKAERYLVVNIQDKFAQLKAYHEGGRLLAETDCWLTDNQMRRPDLAFFSKEAIRVVDDSSEPIPPFVIEIISPSDTVQHVEQKIIEYFEAGVQVIWHIHPELRMVRVFTSLRRNITCFENDAFDASPAIPDLELTVEELFTL